MSRTILTLGLLVVVLFLSAERGTTFAQGGIEDKPIGSAFDSYGNLRGCDHSARLDNFAIQMQNTPEGYGYVVV